ncbi:MAG TPA: hypothetical protein VF572_03435 [Candidatus Saccharimonadales bacterium]|jgi:hypothetical protein
MPTIDQDRSPTDGEWYALLKPLIDAIGEPFERLMPPKRLLDGAFDDFVRSGYTADPSLFPVIDDREGLGLTRASLSKLHNMIVEQEPSSQIRELYASKIQELQLQIDLVLAAGTHDKAKYHEANISIYGMPDKDVFSAACDWVRRQAQQTGNVEVLTVIPEISHPVKAAFFPDQRTFDAVRVLHDSDSSYMKQLFGTAHLAGDTLFTPKNGDQLVRSAIKNIGSAYELIDSENGLWSVLHSRNAVARPPGYDLNPEAFYGIVCHEVGSHLLESVRGAASGLRLLESGLDRYECGNEGRAFLREQIQYQSMEEYVSRPPWHPMKASWHYRVALHIVISLATGVGGRQYGFADAFAVVMALFRMWNHKAQHPKEILVSGAWNLVVRALKGTDGTGGAYHKDIVYLEGNIRCWQAAQDWPALILLGDRGKFDIANNRHVILLSELGIMPKTPSRH